jgi:hypothetical protein
MRILITHPGLHSEKPNRPVGDSCAGAPARPTTSQEVNARETERRNHRTSRPDAQVMATITDLIGDPPNRGAPTIDDRRRHPPTSPTPADSGSPAVHSTPVGSGRAS